MGARVRRWRRDGRRPSSIKLFHLAALLVLSAERLQGQASSTRCCRRWQGFARANEGMEPGSAFAGGHHPFLHVHLHEATMREQEQLNRELW